MYNEKLEALISAALADGVLTEKEKQILFKKAEAMGIDLDEFEMVLDARLVELKKKEAREDQLYRLEMEKAKSAQQSAPKSEKFGDVRKCPACGAMVESLMTKCPECGHVFTNIEANSTTKKLMQKIDEIQAQSAQMMNAIKSENEKVAQEQRYAVEQQISDRIDQAIQNFPIPNTKEDLIEFLTLCISNSHGDDSTAWKNKLKQVIAKAKVLLPRDEDVQTIIDEYEEGKAKKRKKTIVLSVIGAVVGIIIFGILIYQDGNPEYNTKNDAGKTTVLVEQALKDGDIAKAEALINDYSNQLFQSRKDIQSACNALAEAKEKQKDKEKNDAIDAGDYDKAFDGLDCSGLDGIGDDAMIYYERICMCLDDMKKKGKSVSEMQKFIDRKIEAYDKKAYHEEWSKANVKKRLYDYIR